jgi:flavin reductase (DIM6/NTAB) family NADH-FMN oxidoreductase RutF
VPLGEISKCLDGPMVIVTARAGEDRSGCLVGFTTQCSINPPRWLVCISEANATHDVAMRADMLVVHFLESDSAGRQLAKLFGGQTQDEVDKFSLCRWADGPGDTPLLLDCGAWLAGPVVARLAAGDHTAMVLDPTDGGVNERWTKALGYQHTHDIEPGHPA